jgi:hypothetical protein
MNAPVNQSGSHAEDDVVSAIYRLTADENAPDHLNQTILRRARKAGARSPAKFWQIGWLQPIALVAVVGLSLSLILDIDELVDADDPAAAVSQGRNSLDRAAAAALEQIREAESLAQQNPGVSDSTTPPLMVEQINPGNISRDDNPPCSVTQRSTTALWWQCIQSLERRGYAEAATIEYEALFAAYPAFEVP